MSLSFHTDHLSIVLRSLRGVFDAVQLTHATPVLASWRSAGFLIHLADDPDISDKDVAACLVLARDFLNVAVREASARIQGTLNLQLESVCELLGLPSLLPGTDLQRTEHAMIVNLALLDLARIEDADCRLMVGALEAAISRREDASLLAAVHLLRTKDAPLRQWFEFCMDQPAQPNTLSAVPEPPVVPESEKDVLKAFAKQVAAKKTDLPAEKKDSKRLAISVGEGTNREATLLRSRWRRR